MMRAASLLTLTAALLTITSGCDRSKLDERKWRAAGAEAVMPFKKNLKAALIAGLQEGPAEAIAACRVEAPALAEKASNDRVRVGRTSDKLRNPSNAPKAWMVPLLDAYREASGPIEPLVVQIDETTVGYVEPIYTQPICVTCHGTTIAPELEEKLRALYPEDQARGYAAGDLRGVFWAELARD